ncbi:hypothetical protein SynROS8604_02922 [Synechococcus sp. ROS8604]|nr:hypothetical protein SynROS8604_02922 [Synechococcus sp. ROS8604]
MGAYLTNVLANKQGEGRASQDFSERELSSENAKVMADTQRAWHGCVCLRAALIHFDDVPG